MSYGMAASLINRVITGSHWALCALHLTWQSKHNICTMKTIWRSWWAGHFGAFHGVHIDNTLGLTLWGPGEIYETVANDILETFYLMKMSVRFQKRSSKRVCKGLFGWLVLFRAIHLRRRGDKPLTDHCWPCCVVHIASPGLNGLNKLHACTAAGCNSSLISFERCGLGVDWLLSWFLRCMLPISKHLTGGVQPWRHHNDVRWSPYGASNHRHLDCLRNKLFRKATKKSSKPYLYYWPFVRGTQLSRKMSISWKTTKKSSKL